MTRNIEKQTQQGKKLIEERMGYDISMSELKVLIDEYNNSKNIYETIVKTFYFGVAVGSRAKGGK